MKKVITILLVATLLATALVGCAAPAAPQATAAPAPAATAAPVAEATAAPAATEAPAAPLSGNLKVIGSTSVGPLMVAIKDMFIETNKDVTIDVEQVGSGPGIVAAKDGSANIGMASRALKDEEKPLNEYTLCLDGIAVVVHPDNAVAALTKDQIQKIYMGEIKNWKDVGGADAEITLVTRESTSGTRGAFEELVLPKETKIDDTLCIVQNSNGNVAQAVESDPNALGYISLGIVGEFKVKAVSVDGIDATIENIVNGSYKIARPFLLLTNGNENELTKAFLDFLLNNQAVKDYIVKKAYILK